MRVSTGAFVARRNGKVFVTGNSGFPKSHNVSKGIDKAAGKAEERGYVEATGGLHGGSGNTVGKFTGKQLSDVPVTDEAKQWDGWGTALKPAHEPVVVARKPLTPVPLATIMSEVEDVIGGILCQLLGDASSAELVLRSSPPAPSGTSGSALLIAAVLRGGQSDEWCEGMVTSNSPEVASTCLSIARSWRTISDAVSTSGSMFTTSTETALITALEILKSSTSAIMPADIIQAASRPVGEPSSAQDAEESSNDGQGNSTLTPEHIAAALATLRQEFINASGVEMISTAGVIASSALRSVITRLQGDAPPDAHPAHEPIVLARKPLIGTVVANVLEHGTGAINIGATRVGTEARHNPSSGHDPEDLKNRRTVTPVSSHKETEERECVGRFPANVALSYPEDEYLLRSDITDEQKDELYRWMRENT